jgi:oxygen-independent coproporphyrinogen-3 oxidase
VNQCAQSGGAGDSRGDHGIARSGDGAAVKARQDPVAVYVHVPFCPSKCGYCDFNSFAMTGPIVERTVDATVRQIEHSSWRGWAAKTVFFGGGTPTLLTAHQLTRLLEAVRQAHPWATGTEVTIEANPGTLDEPKCEALLAAGFTRISIGAQSFHPQDLVRLGRAHDVYDVGRSLHAARRAGFRNVNLDLMFGLPGQSRRSWRENLARAIELGPEHLSLYCLTIEPNTRFHRLAHSGLLDLPDDAEQVEMYDLAVRMAEDAGYRLYEISNFARPGYECRHNLCYWRGEEYLGYGPGAVGCFATEKPGHRMRYTNQKHPHRFCDAIESGALPEHCEVEELSPAQIRFERLMLGIRLAEGIEPELASAPGVIHRVAAKGWVHETGGRVALTPAGRHFCSEVAVDLA